MNFGKRRVKFALENFKWDLTPILGYSLLFPHFYNVALFLTRDLSHSLSVTDRKPPPPLPFSVKIITENHLNNHLGSLRNLMDGLHEELNRWIACAIQRQEMG